MAYKKSSLFLFFISLGISAERLTTKNVTDTQSNALFSQLLEYRSLNQTMEQLTATTQAAYSVLKYLAPSIQNLTAYTGLFTANCTILFNDVIERVDCDVNPTDYTRTLTPSSEIFSGHRLPNQDKTQITQSNILYADIFADWRSRKSQEFDTDLYFKADTCSETPSSTPTITPSKTASVTPSVSPSVSATISPSVSASKTATLTDT